MKCNCCVCKSVDKEPTYCDSNKPFAMIDIDEVKLAISSLAFYISEGKKTTEKDGPRLVSKSKHLLKKLLTIKKEMERT